VSETKELKTCYEAKKRSCSTCCTTSQVYNTFSFGKCASPCRVLHFSWDTFVSFVVTFPIASTDRVAEAQPQPGGGGGKKEKER
jgi:hypothetical protein